MAIYGIGSRVIRPDNPGRVGTITHVYRDHLAAPWAYIRWDGGNGKAYPAPVADLAYASSVKKGAR